jgi:hypothetical protein
VIEIVINAGDAPTLRLWHAVAELTERLPAGWVLIGGLMVQLHAIEHGVVDVRPTRDIDVLGQARPSGALPAVNAALRSDGFALHDPDLEGYGYRYERDDLIVDLLAPDGLKPPPTLGGGERISGLRREGDRHLPLSATRDSPQQCQATSSIAVGLPALGDPDDRLPGHTRSVGAERGGHFGQRPDSPHIRSQSSVAQPLGELGELGAIGLHDEEDRPPVLGLFRGRFDRCDERAAGAYKPDGTLEDVPADQVEHHVGLSGFL